MTLKAIYNRALRDIMYAAGRCIVCKGDNPGPFLRCEPCGEKNRRGVRKYGDPAAVLMALEVVDVSTLSDIERRRMNEKRCYWRKKVKRAS